MIKVSAKVTKNVELPKPKSVSEALVEFIKKSTFKLVAYIKREKLSGDPLNVRTGRLRRSINAKFSNGGKTGHAGTNVSYGAVHELGLQVQIAEHKRIMTQVFGKPVDPFEVSVSGHTRVYPERSFLRSALKELEPELVTSFRKVVSDSLRPSL